MSLYQQKLTHLKNTCFSNQKQLETVIATRHFINHHFEQDLKLELLAQVRFTSKFHLHRLFKRYYGVTPKQYLIEKRIEQSKERLKNGMTVTATCFAVGFESLGSFSKLFKTKTGKSPSAFQKEQDSRSKLHLGC